MSFHEISSHLLSTIPLFSFSTHPQKVKIPKFFFTFFPNIPHLFLTSPPYDTAPHHQPIKSHHSHYLLTHHGSTAQAESLNRPSCHFTRWSYHKPKKNIKVFREAHNWERTWHREKCVCVMCVRFVFFCLRSQPKPKNHLLCHFNLSQKLI